MNYRAKQFVPGNPKVSLALVAYRRVDPLMCLLYSLRVQTYANWEVVVYHDGHNPEVEAAVKSFQDPRMVYACSAVRHNNYGHSNRKAAVSLCTGDYIGMGNDDNYYVPGYFEVMLAKL